MITTSDSGGCAGFSYRFALGEPESSTVYVRYRVENTSEEPREATLYLAVRPLQVNPPWQHGGIAAIRTIAVEGTDANASVRINGREFVQSLTPITAAGAAAFGDHGETEITGAIAAGQLPATRAASDDDGLASAALAYRVDVPPHGTRDVVLAFPLVSEHVDFSLPSPPAAPAAA